MSALAEAKLATQIDALLPQTQCTRCGFDGCRPYAEAIVRGEADINQCPPGGANTIQGLALLLKRPSRALNPAIGVESLPMVAVIDEARCIGCARCLAPCPVDAIVGAPKFLHTVVADLCTGCELCIPPCPVDCIDLKPSSGGIVPAALNQRRFHAHTERQQRRVVERQRLLDAKKALAPLKPVA